MKYTILISGGLEISMSSVYLNSNKYARIKRTVQHKFIKHKFNIIALPQYLTIINRPIKAKFVLKIIKLVL